jgi:NADPH:quinone reductase-like Zn-dependent oxidoreductase
MLMGTAGLVLEVFGFFHYISILSGADIVVDFMGGDYIQRNFKTCDTDARVIFLAFDLGAKAEVNFMPIMLKRLRLTGATLRPRPPEFKAAVAAELRERVWPLFPAGKLQTVTHKVFDFAEAAEAHAYMEAGGHAGKILLKH